MATRPAVLLALIAAVLLGGCPPDRDGGVGGDASRRGAVERGHMTGKPQPTPADGQPNASNAGGDDGDTAAARRAAEEALRRGAPGVTEPVYDPSLADQPGRTYRNRAEAQRAQQQRDQGGR